MSEGADRFLDSVSEDIREIRRGISDLKTQFAAHAAATKGHGSDIEALKARVRAVERRLTATMALGGGAVVASPHATDWVKGLLI